MTFLLVSVNTKRFISSGDDRGTGVVYKWDVSPNELWDEDSNSMLVHHNAGKMLISEQHHGSATCEKLFDNLSGVRSDNIEDFPQARLEPAGDGLYSIRGTHSYVAELLDSDRVQTFNNASVDADIAVFRKVDVHDTIGCVHWGAAYRSTDLSNFVEEGLRYVRNIGFGVAKVKVSNPLSAYRGRVPPHDESSAIDIMEKVFKDQIQSFHTVVLSVWSDFSKEDESYFLRLDGSELLSALERERSFFFDFTRYLEQNYVDKTFILQNWEGDWKFESVIQDVDQVQKLLAWVKARQTGVSDARCSLPRRGVSRVLHAFEVNKVVGGVGDASKKNATTEIVSEVQLDLVSYSCYEDHRHGALADTLNFIEAKLDVLGTSDYMLELKKIDARFNKRVFLGEFGEPENNGQGSISENTDILVNAFSWGCPLVVYWSILENEWDFQSGINPGRGLYLPISPELVESGEDAPVVDVKLSNVGLWFRSLLHCAPT